MDRISILILKEDVDMWVGVFLDRQIARSTWSWVSSSDLNLFNSYNKKILKCNGRRNHFFFLSFFFYMNHVVESKWNWIFSVEMSTKIMENFDSSEESVF